MTVNSRRIVIVLLAPPPPPCFEDRSVWVEYLTTADMARGDGERGPLCSRKGEAVFNHQFSFCKDCLATHALSMVAQNRCNPQHLTDMLNSAPAEAPVKAAA